MDWMEQSVVLQLPLLLRLVSGLVWIWTTPYQRNWHPGTRRLQVERSMRVLDGACMVYCAVYNLSLKLYGVKRTNIKCSIREQDGPYWCKLLPCCFKTRLGGNPVPIVVPIGAHSRVLLTLSKWKRLSGMKRYEVWICWYPSWPSWYVWRTKMVEAAAEASEELMDLKKVIFLKKRSLQVYVLVFWNSSNALWFCVQEQRCLLDAVIEFLPSPTEVKAISLTTKTKLKRLVKHLTKLCACVQNHERQIRR